MSRRVAGWLALATLACAMPARAEIVERVLAVVEDRPVLLGDVRLLAAVRGLDEHAALEALIDERLMLRAATRLPRATLTPALEEAALDDLRRRLPPAAADAPPAALRRLARRQATILRYVELRFRPLIRIDEASVRAAYAFAWGSAPHAPAFAEAEAGLREALGRAALDRQIEAWIQELRSGATIRYEPGS